MIAPLLALTKGAQSNHKSELEPSQQGFCAALRTGATREGSPRRGGGRGHPRLRPVLLSRFCPPALCALVGMSAEGRNH